MIVNSHEPGLRSNSNQPQISPCFFSNVYLTPEVMRIKNMITQSEFSCYFNNFYKKSMGTLEIREFVL